MKTHHTTIVLMTLFFTGLLVLWWANYAEVPTEDEREQMLGLMLPELRRTPVAEIARIEIAHGPKKRGGPGERLVFERSGEGWQLVEPVHVAADPSRVETLAQNLKAARKSIDAGTIHDPASHFGLAPPAVVVRAFKAGAKAPLAVLEIGKSVRDRLYVRPGGASGIEVVDARLFSGIDEPAREWREAAVFNLPTFQVAGLDVSGPGRMLKAERRDGHWTIQEPVHAPGDAQRFEEVLAELTSLRVTNVAKGFVAEDVKDFTRYGLEKSSAIRVELVPTGGRGKPQVLFVGKPSPDEEGKLYAVRSDQDDVILVDARGFRDLGVDPNALRSRKVLDFDPQRASFLEIEAFGKVFDLSRSATGWQLLRPTREPADSQQVPGLLTRLAGLQTAEFLDPDRVVRPEVDHPPVRIKLWEAKAGAKFPARPGEKPEGAPRFDLRIGRHDVLKKSLFARLEGDKALLALTDDLLEVLPSNAFAYRNRTMASVSPAQVERLSIRAEGRSVVLAPGQAGGAPNTWRMIAPVEAPASDEAVTKALLTLSPLTAQRLISDQSGLEPSYGLDAPSLEVQWTPRTEPGTGKGAPGGSTTTLRVGSKVPNTESRYAKVSGSPLIFTLGEASLLPFHEEFHSRIVLAFPTPRIARLVLRWPGKSMAFAHRQTPRGGTFDWTAERGTDLQGFDLSRVDSLAADLARLQTRKFVQYAGPFADSTSLNHPRLTIEIELGGKSPARHVLRVGGPAGGNEFFATAVAGTEGPVFLLAGSGWAELVKPPGEQPLPDDVFAPDSPAK